MHCLFTCGRAGIACPLFVPLERRTNIGFRFSNRSGATPDVVPAKPGTHTPCPVEWLRPHSPSKTGASARFTRGFDACGPGSPGAFSRSDPAPETLAARASPSCIAVTCSQLRALGEPRCAYRASGSGRIWKCTILGDVPLPPSRWNGVRLPVFDHTPRPFQPALGSSMRPSSAFAQKPIG